MAAEPRWLSTKVETAATAVSAGVAADAVVGVMETVGGGSAVVVVAVAARDIMDRVDRVIRRNFGFTGKSPPEKFSGGGGGGWPAAAGLGERI
uniref:Uncharacterized protein n=1 Tax=Tanacetum cinerariifolium TaxID=118510 RepID=A0A6L2KF58_TANCI|nr:hypothetical protein [Tanacetum cinerariifolium]